MRGRGPISWMKSGPWRFLAEQFVVILADFCLIALTLEIKGTYIVDFKRPVFTFSCANYARRRGKVWSDGELAVFSIYTYEDR